MGPGAGGERRSPPRAPTGTHDVLWPESWLFELAVARFGRLVQGAGYGLVQSPMFEYAEVFHRGIGEGSDVVRKEMYEFADRDGQMLALRPEGTASVVRAFVQHHPLVPWKSWYMTPAFRHERPQAGRYRQHHQLGVEALGSGDADLDVEVVSLAADFLAGMGLLRLVLKLNSMGDGVCRPGYLARLREFLADRREELCEEHRGRLEANPLRALDCKRPECLAATEEAPRFVDYLCEECAAHFARVRAGLEALEVAFVLDHRLVRGFDYYTRTTFEFSSEAIEAAQNGVGGGGRYDGLVEVLGGPPTPGVGFGIGIERVLLAAQAEGTVLPGPPPPDAFVIDLTDGMAALQITADLRRAGLSAERSFERRSMKAQMRQADKSGARLALIVGPEELEGGTVSVRALRSEDQQRSVNRSEVVEVVQAQSGKGG